MIIFKERSCTVIEPTNSATNYVSETQFSHSEKKQRVSKCQQKACVTLLMLNERDRKAKSTIWDKETHTYIKEATC